MFNNLTAEGIIKNATLFSGSFDGPIIVAVGLGVAITVAYAIKNMF